MTTRPIVSMNLYSTGVSQAGHGEASLSGTPSAEEAERIAHRLSSSIPSSEESTDWQAVLSALGWQPTTDFIKCGVRFVLSIPPSSTTSAGATGKPARGWYTEALLYRIFAEEEEEEAPEEDVKTQDAEESKNKSGVDGTEMEVEEVQIVTGDGSAQPAAQAPPKAEGDPAEDSVRDPQAKVATQGTAQKRTREVATGTLLLQLMTTVEAGMEEEGMERAREWMGDVIAGCKSFVLLSKEE